MKSSFSKHKVILISAIIAAIITGIFTIIAALLKPIKIDLQTPTPIQSEVDKNEPKPAIDKNESKSVSEFNKKPPVVLPETNILIFNACNHKKAHSLLRTKMKEIYPEIIIDAQYDWLARWEMSKTEIYFITKDFKVDAENLEKWFPGEQLVVDYQEQKVMRELERRDIVIFIGNDYRKVFEIFFSSNQ